jgi:thioesterase domain-containing protein
LVAFEMALQLQAQGRPPALLVLLDSHPPEVLSRFAERADDATILAALAREHAQQLGLEVALAAEELRPLEPAARLEAVVDRLRRAGAVSSHTEAAWMARILAVYHSGLRVARAYQPACAFDGPTVLFKPADTSDEERTELSRLIELPWDDSTNGWQRRCTAAVQSVSIPGNHATLGVEPNVGALAERLTTVLGRLPSTVQDPTQPTRS